MDLLTTNHTASDVFRLYSGSYNIVDSKIHFRNQEELIQRKNSIKS